MYFVHLKGGGPLGGLDYFETQRDSWAKFERSRLFEQQCTGPLLFKIRI